jgi:hypothetical protein
MRWTGHEVWCKGKCIQGFSEETLRKKDHLDNIKVDVNEMEWKHID